MNKSTNKSKYCMLNWESTFFAKHVVAARRFFVSQNILDRNRVYLPQLFFVKRLYFLLKVILIEPGLLDYHRFL